MHIHLSRETQHFASLFVGKRIHNVSVYSFALPSSKVQATFKQENSHKPTPTHIVYLRLIYHSAHLAN